MVVEYQRLGMEFQRKPTKVLDGGAGIYVDGLTIQVDTKQVDGMEG